MRIPIYDKEGRKKAEVLEIDEKIFGEEVKRAVLKEAVLMYEARKRQGTHSTKTVSECAGSGKKLWRQKGTGRARVKTARSPIWKGGGVAFGPKPRDYSYSINKKALKVALNSAWLGKLLDKEVVVIEEFPTLERPKTSAIFHILKNMNLDKENVLLGILNYDNNLWKSARNIPSVSMDTISKFNAYKLLTNKKVLLSVEALKDLVEKRGGEIEVLERKDIYKS